MQRDNDVEEYKAIVQANERKQAELSANLQSLEEVAANAGDNQVLLHIERVMRCVCVCVRRVCYCVSICLCVDESKKQAQELQERLSMMVQQLKEQEEQLNEKCQEIEEVTSYLIHTCILSLWHFYYLPWR